MSENIAKCMLVLEIKELEGKSMAEVFPYFREKLGEPSEIDTCDDEVLWFEYYGDMQPISSGNKWGVGYVLSEEKEDYNFESTIVTLGYLHDIAQSKFGAFWTDETATHDFILADLHWYSGVDPPDIFEEVDK